VSFLLFCFVFCFFLLLRKTFTGYVKKVKRKSSEMKIYDKYDSMGLTLHISLEKKGFFLSVLFLIKKYIFYFYVEKKTKNKQNKIQYSLLTPLVFSLVINFLLTHLVNMVYNKAKTWI